MAHLARLRNGLWASALALAACGGQPAKSDPGGKGGQSGMVVPDGVPVQATLTAEQSQEVARLRAVMTGTSELTAESLLAKRALPFRQQLGYDPAAAGNLGMVQASALKLNEAELAVFKANGFAISDRQRFPHFAHGYQAIYSQDLPVFISADSILEAVHQSYDEILNSLEVASLAPELTLLLDSMRTRLAGIEGIDEATRTDVDLYLSVASSLLADAAAPPVAGATMKAVSELYDLAKLASGSKDMKLFGVQREIDFSQFKPRGHYKDDPRLERYFRAMMWLGRIDFPMLHTTNEGKQVLVRRSVAAALALRALMDEAALTRYRHIDNAIRAFVGEPDSMTPLQVDALKTDLGLTGINIASVSDEAMASALVKGAYGKQKILSQIVMQKPHDEAWPLDATFLFLGQRYVFDSHVFSNVVYDRVTKPAPTPRRMLPDPLDTAYAALANDQAAGLLAPPLSTYAYAPELETMRVLGDEHGQEFWQANLYNLWLSALRALSPTEIAVTGSGLPALALSEPWGRRLLNTQLASWAQLRHDTILYAKQSYTTGVACEFPDAYVEPYPAFFAALEAFAVKGAAVAAALPTAGEASQLMARIQGYFNKLQSVTGILREMAAHQRSGMPHKPEHLAFINQVVSLQLGCGGPAGITGWYADLFFHPWEAAEFDPVVADVHTAPTDANGAPVGWVLHVGTGWPRLMAMTVDTCMGPRAYVGVVSSFHQVVTEKLERLDDEQWAAKFKGNMSMPDPAWMSGLIAR